MLIYSDIAIINTAITPHIVVYSEELNSKSTVTFYIDSEDGYDRTSIAATIKKTEGFDVARFKKHIVKAIAFYIREGTFMVSVDDLIDCAFEAYNIEEIEESDEL